MAERAMTFFRTADAPTLIEDGIMSMPEIAPEVYTTYDLSGLVAGEETTVLFKGEGQSGFSLVKARWGRGYRLPRHTHSADCLYFVLAGEIVMGSRTLAAGDGFFVKAESPYTYTAGPDGAEVLEFRTATSFDMKITDRTVESWKPIVEALQANHEHWVADKAAATSA